MFKYILVGLLISAPAYAVEATKAPEPAPAITTQQAQELLLWLSQTSIKGSDAPEFMNVAITLQKIVQQGQRPTQKKP